MTLVLATMMVPMALHLFFPALPGVKSSMQVDESLAQLSISLPMFVMAFLTLAYGSLSDRLGRRPVLLAGILLFTTGSALAAIADSIWLLLAARCIQAAGGACGGTIARAIARDVYGPDRLVKMIAYLTMAFALGPMLAVPLGGQMVDALGWRSVVIFAAVAGVMLVTLVFFVIAETHRPAPATFPAAPRPTLWRDYATLLSMARFQGYVWQTGASSGVFFTIAPGAAIVMVDYLNYSAAEFGLWFPLFPIGFMLGNFVASRLSNTVSPETMVLTSALLQAMAVAALAIFAALDMITPITLFGPGAAITFAGGLGLSYAQAGAIRLAGDRAGTAAGIGMFLQMFCGAVFTQIFGLVADGTITPFVLTIAGAACIGVIAGAIPFSIRIAEGRLRRRAAQSPDPRA